MFRRPQTFIKEWAFLFQGIPTNGYRLFWFAYGGFLILSLLLMAESKPNVLDRTIINWVHDRPILRARWCEQLSTLGDGAFLRKACAAGVLVLFTLRKWKYVPSLLIGLLSEMWFNA